MPAQMRVGLRVHDCEGFARQWMDIHVDEVIACDSRRDGRTFHGYTRCGMECAPPVIIPAGIYSLPGRYFGTPGTGWGGSSIMNAREAVARVWNRPRLDQGPGWWPLRPMPIGRLT